MKQSYPLSILLFLFSFIACNKDELKAPIPAYLTINDVSVKINDPKEGSASDNITDVIVFIDDQSLGFFELPASIPIQQTGQHNLKIRGVIRVDGNSNNKQDYPFYTTYEVDTLFVAEQEISISPVVEYFSTVDFTEPWSGEDFEGGIDFEYNPDSDTVFVRESDPSKVFEGNYSGSGILDSSDDLFEAWTPTFSNIPRNGTAVFMELNYKSTHTFVVGIYTNNQSSESAIVFFKPRFSWTKVYINLGEVFSILSTASNYNLSFGIQKPLGEEGELQLDNVKLLHF